jgi:hypothetical protein
MNFQELLSRMSELDQPVQEADKGDMDHDGENEPDDKEYTDNKDAAIKQAMGKKVEEEVVDECGDMPGMSNMPSGMMGMRNDQADSVNMNVSINAAGSGGIKDLMNILKNIDDNGGHDHSDMPAPFGQMDEPEVTIKKEPGFDSMMSQETFANEPDEMYGSVANVTQGGGDLNRPKQAYPRVQPGDNAMAEALVTKLSSLYEEIKSR